MDRWKTYLEGGDLRSIADVDQLIPLIRSQSDFDTLFTHLYSENRLIVMRAADAIEKITVANPEFLKHHKGELSQMLQTADNKELKWHLALMIPRLTWSTDELEKVWSILFNWAKDRSESKIVRVNSIQALFDLKASYEEYENEFVSLVEEIKKENIPSINARLRKLI